jgi:hypothetical protein
MITGLLSIGMLCVALPSSNLTTVPPTTFQSATHKTTTAPLPTTTTVTTVAKVDTAQPRTETAATSSIESLAATLWPTAQVTTVTKEGKYCKVPASFEND